MVARGDRARAPAGIPGQHAHVWSFTDGEATTMTVYGRPAEGLEAVGLEAVGLEAQALGSRPRHD
ncbi:MAG: hypothetical protein ACLQMH_14400 [Solirubrobacteraceae bacterium]